MLINNVVHYIVKTMWLICDWKVNTWLF